MSVVLTALEILLGILNMAKWNSQSPKQHFLSTLHQSEVVHTPNDVILPQLHLVVVFFRIR